MNKSEPSIAALPTMNPVRLSLPMPEHQACRHRSLRQEKSASIEISLGVMSIITAERSDGARLRAASVLTPSRKTT